MADHVQKRRKLWDELDAAVTVFDKIKDDPDIHPQDMEREENKVAHAASAFVAHEKAVLVVRTDEEEPKLKERLRATLAEYDWEDTKSDNPHGLARAGRKCASAIEGYLAGDVDALPPGAMEAYVKEALDLLGLTEETIKTIADHRSPHEAVRYAIPDRTTPFGTFIALDALCAHMRAKHNVSMQRFYMGSIEGVSQATIGVKIFGTITPSMREE